MVSSSLDQNIKKAFQKDKRLTDSECSFENHRSDEKFNYSDTSIPNEKIQSMFPKCKPRNDQCQYQTFRKKQQDFSRPTNLTSIESSLTNSAIDKRANSNNNNLNLNNKSLTKIQSPDHKNQHHSHNDKFMERHVKNFGIKMEKNHDYVETNPFRTGNNNQYFCTPIDTLYGNKNSTLASSNNNRVMDRHHYPPMNDLDYQSAMEDRNYFFEPDEIEHNPYMIHSIGSSRKSVHSTILNTSPPATPLALSVSPKTTPTETSPLRSNQNTWDLSPIKSTTASLIKAQLSSPNLFTRSNKGSYKKLTSPIPVEEDLETGHFSYNSKKNYYEETDSDLNELATIQNVHDVDSYKYKSLPAMPETKEQLESNDFVYNDFKKKEVTQIIKSKCGSGIMEYEGSPRRFGALINEDNGSLVESNDRIVSLKNISNNYSAPSPPKRPGFPKRVSSYNPHTKPPNDIQKHLKFDDQLVIPLFTEPPQENFQKIYEESEDNSLRDHITVKSQINDAANVFQVTSPTENSLPTTTFDYLYEFSETRKVLEEFFKCPESDRPEELQESDDSLDIKHDYRVQFDKEMKTLYGNQNKGPSPIKQEIDIDDDNRDDRDDDEEEKAYIKAKQNVLITELKLKHEPCESFVDSASRSSLGDDVIDKEDKSSLKHNRSMSKSLTNNNYFRRQSKNFNYSPDTTDYDSNYGDLDFESESPMRYLSSEYANIQQCNNMGITTIPSATVDLSGGPINNYARFCTSMPVLEDGLSSGHSSDNENNNNDHITSFDKTSFNKRIVSSISTIQKQYQENLLQSKANNKSVNSFNINNNNLAAAFKKNILKNNEDTLNTAQSPLNYHSFYPLKLEDTDFNDALSKKVNKNLSELDSNYTFNSNQITPPPPAPPDQEIKTRCLPHKKKKESQASPLEQETFLKDYNSSAYGLTLEDCHITDYYERSPLVSKKPESPIVKSPTPVWIPRSQEKGFSPVPHETRQLIPKNKNNLEDDEEELDTDLETDRLLGRQTLDDGFYDDKTWTETSQYRPLATNAPLSKTPPKESKHWSIPKSNSSSVLKHGQNMLLPSSSSECCINSPSLLTHSTSFQQSRSLKASPSLNTSDLSNLVHSNFETSPLNGNEISTPQLRRCIDEEEEQSARKNALNDSELYNLDNELADSPGRSGSDKSKKNDIIADDRKKNKNKEVLIEGVLFRARYLGSTQLVCEGQPTKSTRMMQAEEAVSRIKALAPDGENQPNSTEVDLFISTEKIMVLNTDLKEIMMDHALRTISYIADIGDLVVLMARRRFVSQDIEANSDSGTGTGGSGNVSGGTPTPPTSGKLNRTPKMICHVFESEEAQFIAQSIGQAFQVAYMEFLKANGIEDHSFMKEMDYQEVLNSQEIFGDELEIFAKKELQKEVVVPKAKGEILGVVIVESGWGSMLPTVVIANLASNGAAARCGQLNIGDQIIAINGLSLVGLPLSQCQTYIKNTKNQTVVKFTVVPCAPVVEVKIKRPNTKYQLGFSVQNGVICSLLRGGIAERGGVRVGHRIIEINNQSVVAVPHEKIVNLLATSVGEILMKTMPTSMFRLLTGQENPIYI